MMSFLYKKFVSYTALMGVGKWMQGRALAPLDFEI